MSDFCYDHPEYNGYRRPSNECLSCWRVYFLTKNKSLDEYSESVSSKNPELSGWLKENEEAISNAPVYRRAYMESGMEFVDTDDLIVEEGVDVLEAEEVIVEQPKLQKGRFV
jgi:hypothetical protein